MNNTNDLKHVNVIIKCTAYNEGGCMDLFPDIWNKDGIKVLSPCVFDGEFGEGSTACPRGVVVKT